MTNAERFLKKVLKDPKLRTKCAELANKGDIKELEKIAKSIGTPCTFAEVKEALLEGQQTELTDEELLRFSGGERKT